MAIAATPAPRMLIVDDEVPSMQALCDTLKDSGYDTTGVSTGAEALVQLRAASFDLVLSDMMMPGMDGITLLRQALEIDPDLVGIIMTGQGTIRTAVEAMKSGAFDYILKPCKLNAILPVLSRALAVRELRRENAALQAGLRARTFELENANRDLRETQSQLVQSAKMASLGQLVAGVAHEINNPLAFVMGHQQTIQEGLDVVMAEIGLQLTTKAHARLEKAQVRLRDAHAGLQRIAELVGKLRSFSRLDEAERKTINVEENIEAVITLLQHKLQDRVQVRRNYGDEKMLSCYPGPLNQVVMNLVANAIDAIDGPGVITVSTGQADSHFNISIADTGCGIPEPDRQRIFDPFYTTKPVGQGTGLGLSISYGIVKRHNGTLELRSEVGRGTEMTIRIPLAGSGPADDQEAEHG